MEAKIETARHNLKIKMDKELTILQKQVNLHVSDVDRYQGFVTRIALNRGKVVEELRRDKEIARRTMKQLKAAKQTNKSSGVGQGALAQAGRDSIAASNFKT